MIDTLLNRDLCTTVASGRSLSREAHLCWGTASIAGSKFGRAVGCAEVSNNEWVLIGTRKLNEAEATIEFDPLAYPFGGTECLVALTEAFGHRVIERDDGTEVQAYTPIEEFWQPSGTEFDHKDS